MAIIFISLSIFVVISIILFIRDGILAKKDGRPRKKIFTVLFIMSILILGACGIVITCGVLLAALYTPSYNNIGGSMGGM